jgi:ubiquinol-cytochrome c reductase cytochrome c subunit
MNTRALVVTAGLVGAAVAMTLAVGPHRSASAAVPTQPVTRADAKRTFLSDCAVCHGADAHGTNMGPTLSGVGVASIDYELTTGRMPLVEAPARNPRTGVLQPLPGQELPDAQAKTERHRPAYPPDVIEALDAYVGELSAGGPDIPTIDVAAGALPVGGELFRLQCAACHAWAGDGGALLHREAPALHAATPTQIGEAIRVGPGTMPGFGFAAISEQDLNSVVAYVRYLDHPKDRGGQPFWHLGPVAEGGVAWLIGMTLLVLATRWIGERS